MPEAFVPARLTQARRRRSLTKGRLAALSQLSVKTIASYENGTTVPSDETILVLAKALEFPPEFFSAGEPLQIHTDRVSFRALTTMTAAQRGTALAAGELAIELDNWIANRFNRPAASVPDLRGATPEVAADAVRAEWGLGNRMVPHLIHRLEAQGVRVFSLVQESREVDAFSMWWGETPYMFLNTVKTAERSRFDAAHELGHLVLHRHGAPNGRAAESEANQFASAFLMPRADVLAQAPRYPTVATIIQAKRIWGVSAMALVHRLHALKRLTDWQYQQLCIRFRSQFGASEPDQMARESSQSLAKVLAALRGEGVGRREIARDLKVFTRELDELIFGLVLTPIAGQGSAATEPPPISTAKLKVL